MLSWASFSCEGFMLLSLLILFPIVCALIVWALPSEKIVRPFSLVAGIAHFCISLQLFGKFNSASAGLQLAEQISWIPSFGISYFLAIDGISFWLVIMTTFLFPFLVLSAWSSIEKQVRAFHINLFLLQAAMLGTFFAMDAILFYLFFEASLIPMYFIVGIWGGTRRLYATVKFVLYTMAGSILMLVAILTLMLMGESQLGAITAELPKLYQLKIPFIGGEFFNPQTLMFFAFSIAFAIKVPMFPFHTWLPDAHVEAPTPGSVVLAAVMLKMGTYGFLRFVLPLFPQAVMYWSWLFLFLGVLGIVYGALVAMVQPDIKKLVAYSSVSHMGYVMIGIFCLNLTGATGALYQMLNHGISTGALFILVGMIYERTHSREIEKYGGLASVMPLYTIMFFIVLLSSIAVPGTNGFIGEFLILLGTFTSSKIYGAIAVLGVIFGACYMLWMFKKVFFGPKSKMVEEHHLSDLSLREALTLAPFIILIFWMGLFPNCFLDYSKASLDHLLKNQGQYKLTIDNQSVKEASK